MKKYIDQFNEFKDSKYGKPILFFGFYLIFFIAIFIVIGVFGDKNALIKDYESGNKSALGNTYLLQNNFYYDYKITLDGTLYDYYGKALNDTESFKYNNNDYFKKGDNYFINNGTWVKSENPFKFREFYEPSNMNELLTNGYYSSKTEYDGGAEDYNFLLSINTINKILYGKDSDYDDIPSEAIVTVDKDGVIKNITYKLDNYCKYSGVCNTLKIELIYDLFGEVQEIENPIE